MPTIRQSRSLSRRGFLAGSAAAVSTAALCRRTGAAETAAPMPDVPSEDYRIQNGRIKQSVMGWCFKPISNADLIDACHRMGMPAVEGVGRDQYPKLRELGMKPAIVSGGHGFKKGPFNRDNHAFCIEKLRDGIDVAAEFGSPSVITFTGYREEGIGDEEVMASLARAMNGATVEQATRVLWETYEPWRVWWYLGAFGLAGTVGMIIFYFATRKKTAAA